MKKVIMAFLAVSMLAGGAARQALAQGKKIQLSLNLGVQPEVSRHGHAFDFVSFTLDARIGIRLGKSMELSPELMAVIDGPVHLNHAYFFPGVILNYTTKGFIVGAGVVLPIFRGEEASDTGHPAAKVNVGYRLKNWMLTAYVIAWAEADIAILDANWIGATIGYRF